MVDLRAAHLHLDALAPEAAKLDAMRGRAPTGGTTTDADIDEILQAFYEAGIGRRRLIDDHRGGGSPRFSEDEDGHSE